jgi:Flp pilus assembly protein TadG
MNSNKRFDIRSTRGQAITEFAIVLPVFALLLFGVIQFGIVFNRYLALTDAVRAGARTAAVSRHAASPVDVATARVREAADGLKLGDLQIDVKASPAWTHGSDVTVTASYPYEISLLGLVVQKGRLSSATTERVE